MVFLKKRILLASFLAIGLLTSSCDKEHTKEYYIQNDTDEEINVTFKVDGLIDSATIKQNDTHLIYSHIYYFGTVGVNDDRFEDMISDIKVQRDSISIELNETLWEYVTTGKYYAKYIMTIN